jgi:hypothetical protein
MARRLFLVPRTDFNDEGLRSYDEHFQLYIPPSSPSSSASNSAVNQVSDDQNDDPSYAANKEIKVSLIYVIARVVDDEKMHR